MAKIQLTDQTYRLESGLEVKLIYNSKGEVNHILFGKGDLHIPYMDISLEEFKGIQKLLQ